ncbi:MAG: glycosyltransferase, partial [Myxococcales bacterium]|nr:glycosyltransferase [Myxococcales bacterium]
MSAADTVDVVIPVYNAPELTQRCITSLYAHASPRLGKVIAWDNASSPETRQMLDELDFPGLLVLHAPPNLGFGGAANRG